MVEHNPSVRNAGNTNGEVLVNLTSRFQKVPPSQLSSSQSDAKVLDPVRTVLRLCWGQRQNQNQWQNQQVQPPVQVSWYDLARWLESEQEFQAGKYQVLKDRFIRSLGDDWWESWNQQSQSNKQPQILFIDAWSNIEKLLDDFKEVNPELWAVAQNQKLKRQHYENQIIGMQQFRNGALELVAKSQQNQKPIKLRTADLVKVITEIQDWQQQKDNQQWVQFWDGVSKAIPTDTMEYLGLQDFSDALYVWLLQEYTDEFGDGDLINQSDGSQQAHSKESFNESDIATTIAPLTESDYNGGNWLNLSSGASQFSSKTDWNIANLKRQHLSWQNWTQQQSQSQNMQSYSHKGHTHFNVESFWIHSKSTSSSKTSTSIDAYEFLGGRQRSQSDFIQQSSPQLTGAMPSRNNMNSNHQQLQLPDIPDSIGISAQINQIHTQWLPEITEWMVVWSQTSWWNWKQRQNQNQLQSLLSVQLKQKLQTLEIKCETLQSHFNKAQQRNLYFEKQSDARQLDFWADEQKYQEMSKQFNELQQKIKNMTKDWEAKDQANSDKIQELKEQLRWRDQVLKNNADKNQSEREWQQKVKQLQQLVNKLQNEVVELKVDQKQSNSINQSQTEANFSKVQKDQDKLKQQIKILQWQADAQNSVIKSKDELISKLQKLRNQLLQMNGNMNGNWVGGLNNSRLNQSTFSVNGIDDDDAQLWFLDQSGFPLSLDEVAGGNGCNGNGIGNAASTAAGNGNKTGGKTTPQTRTNAQILSQQQADQALTEDCATIMNVEDAADLWNQQRNNSWQKNQQVQVKNQWQGGNSNNNAIQLQFWNSDQQLGMNPTSPRNRSLLRQVKFFQNQAQSMDKYVNEVETQLSSVLSSQWIWSGNGQKPQHQTNAENKNKNQNQYSLSDSTWMFQQLMAEIQTLEVQKEDVEAELRRLQRRIGVLEDENQNLNTEIHRMQHHKSGWSSHSRSKSTRWRGNNYGSSSSSYNSQHAEKQTNSSTWSGSPPGATLLQWQQTQPTTSHSQSQQTKSTNNTNANDSQWQNVNDSQQQQSTRWSTPTEQSQSKNTNDNANQERGIQQRFLNDTNIPVAVPSDQKEQKYVDWLLSQKQKQQRKQIYHGHSHGGAQSQGQSIRVGGSASSSSSFRHSKQSYKRHQAQQQWDQQQNYSHWRSQTFYNSWSDQPGQNDQNSTNNEKRTRAKSEHLLVGNQNQQNQAAQNNSNWQKQSSQQGSPGRSKSSWQSPGFQLWQTASGKGSVKQQQPNWQTSSISKDKVDQQSISHSQLSNANNSQSQRSKPTTINTYNTNVTPLPSGQWNQNNSQMPGPSFQGAGGRKTPSSWGGGIPLGVGIPLSGTSNRTNSSVGRNSAIMVDGVMSNQNDCAVSINSSSIGGSKSQSNRSKKSQEYYRNLFDDFLSAQPSCAPGKKSKDSGTSSRVQQKRMNNEGDSNSQPKGAQQQVPNIVQNPDNDDDEVYTIRSNSVLDLDQEQTDINPQTDSENYIQQFPNDNEQQPDFSELEQDLSQSMQELQNSSHSMNQQSQQQQQQRYSNLSSQKQYQKKNRTKGGSTSGYQRDDALTSQCPTQ